MTDSNRSNFNGYDGILGHLTAPTAFRASDLDPSASASRWSGPTFAVDRETPVRDYFTFPNPFNFSDFGSTQDRYIWNKLLFDPRLLQSNRFYWLWPDREKVGAFFGPAPMGPLGDSPNSAPKFR